MEISQSEFLAKYNIKEDDYIKTNLDWTELERIHDKHIKDTPVLESSLHVRGRGSSDLHLSENLRDL